MTQSILGTLLSRRSTAIKALSAPGPTAAQMEEILTAATRVPDHGKLAPWWFVVFDGDAREKFGAVLREAYCPQRVLVLVGCQMTHGIGLIGN